METGPARAEPYRAWLGCRELTERRKAMETWSYPTTVLENPSLRRELTERRKAMETSS